MPFGVKANSNESMIDFDRVHQDLIAQVWDAELEPARRILRVSPLALVCEIALVISFMLQLAIRMLVFSLSGPFREAEVHVAPCQYYCCVILSRLWIRRRCAILRPENDCHIEHIFKC